MRRLRKIHLLPFFSRIFFGWCVLSCLWLLPGAAHSAATPWRTNPEGQVRLVSSADSVATGGTLFLGLHFRTSPDWYVYWKKAGDAGYPPKISWKESEGIENPEILWPAPTKFVLPGDILEFGYEGEIVYPIRVHLKPTGRRIRVAATVSYLTCNTSCVPYKYTFTLDLPVGQTLTNTSDTALIDQFRSKVPSATTDDETIMRTAVVREKHIHEEKRENVSGPSLSLVAILFLAFIGGLILNVMPCVLPVLSIKLLGLLQHGGDEKGAIVQRSLASAAGILASFAALAVAAIGARHAGHAVGWGIQFQEPVFVGFLGLVIFLFALNLWGMFELGLPALLGHFAVTFGRGETLSAYFVSGLFATLLATPCSAPFLGTAMGFALSQSAGTIFLIFTAVGLGMALPYFVLAAFPQSLHWLPKPGPWMIHLRTILGFFLAATVVWLGFVLSSQIQPAGLAYFYLSLVAIGFAAWLRELLITHPRLGTPLAKRITAFILMGFLVLALLVIGHYRLPSSAHQSLPTAEDLRWNSFDEGRALDLVRGGKAVFVDVTADWCVTCKYNERFVLNDPEVVKAFQSRDVLMMKADWTNRDPAIATYLMKHGRAGIPFYALYLPHQEPVLLSEFLTKKQVLRALDQLQ